MYLYRLRDTIYSSIKHYYAETEKLIIFKENYEFFIAYQLIA